MMNLKGSDALTNRPALPGDIKTVEINVIEVLISFLKRLIGL